MKEDIKSKETESPVKESWENNIKGKKIKVWIPVKGLFMSLVFTVMKLMGVVTWSWLAIAIPFCLDAVLGIIWLIIAALNSKLGE